MKENIHVQIILKLISVQIIVLDIVDWGIILTKQNTTIFNFLYNIFFPWRKKNKTSTVWIYYCFERVKTAI